MKRSLLVLSFLVLFTLNPVSAAPSWTWEYSDSCMVFSLAINDYGYTAAGFGYYVVLLSPEGKLLFKEPSRGFAYSIAISENNYVVAGTKGFFVQLFGPNGTLIFEYKTGNQVWAVDISPDGREFVAGSNDGRLYFFQGTSLKWKVNTGSPIWGVVMRNGRVYVANDEGLVAAYDFTGKQLWKLNLHGRAWRLHVSGDKIAVLVLHTGNSVTSDVCLISTNGTQLWCKHFDNYIRDVDINDSRLAITGDIGAIEAFSLNGSLLYSFPDFNPAWDVAIRDGYVLAGGGGQQAFFLSPDGEPLWSFQDNKSITVVAMSPNGRYLGVADRTFETVNCEGTIYFIDRGGEGHGGSSTSSPRTTASPYWRFITPILGLFVIVLLAVIWKEMRE